MIEQYVSPHNCELAGSGTWPERSRVRGLPGGAYAWILLAACSAWLHSRIESAWAEPGRVEVGAKLAPSLEQHLGDRPGGSEAVYVYKPGASAGAGVRYGFLYDWLSLQAELLYATRGSNLDLMERTAITFRSTYLELPVLARFQLPFHDGAVRPTWSGYAVVGPSVSRRLTAEAVDSLGSDVPQEWHTWDVGVVAGLGVTWEMTPDLALSLEARFDQGFTEAFEVGNPRNQAFLLTLGVDYTLLDGAGDRDADLVADYRDRCPADKEDENEYQDEDGCPDGGKGDEADKDGDGILADKDKCPGEKEDENGYQDKDGCVDGDLDQDQDGLADIEDKCPREPFSSTGNIKYDKKYLQLMPGCPLAETGRYRFELDPPLEFDPGKHEVSVTQALVLDEVAFLLAEKERTTGEQTCLAVRGHAHKDSEKQTKDAKDQNLRESACRAESVAHYLVNRGIAAKRLIPEGKGDTDLLDEKPDGDGKRNRRVELIIVEASMCKDSKWLLERASCPEVARRKPGARVEPEK
jgi:outer membrane protein OmpA-like peptidoglycan-associated protein